MRTAAIIQARMASSRFPGKVITNLAGTSALSILHHRLHQCMKIQEIVTAIPIGDKELANFIKNHVGWNLFQGSPLNVRERVLKAASYYDVDVIVDVTADCPLIDPIHVDVLTHMVTRGHYDYASNIRPRTWPDGFDVQVYRTGLLEKVHEIDPEAPHVGWQILNLANQGRILPLIFDYPAPPQLVCPKMRLTLDTLEDARVLDKVIRALGQNASAIEITTWMLDHPEIHEINEHVRTKLSEEG